MAMIAITTRSSIKVKDFFIRENSFSSSVGLSERKPCQKRIAPVKVVAPLFAHSDDSFVVRNGDGLEIAHAGGAFFVRKHGEDSFFGAFDKFQFVVDFGNVKGCPEPDRMGIAPVVPGVNQKEFSAAMEKMLLGGGHFQHFTVIELPCFEFAPVKTVSALDHIAAAVFGTERHQHILFHIHDGRFKQTSFNGKFQNIALFDEFQLFAVIEKACGAGASVPTAERSETEGDDHLIVPPEEPLGTAAGVHGAFFKAGDDQFLTGTLPAAVGIADRPHRETAHHRTGTVFPVSQAVEQSAVFVVHIVPDGKDCICGGMVIRLGGYTNIALFGLDNRSINDYESGNSDAIMVASIDNKTKDVKIVSLYRDTYLNVGNNKYSKANSA